MLSEYGIKTLDDFNFEGKTTLVRIDINTPIDLKTQELMDDRRFLSHKETLNELVEKKAKIVLIGHQGRPGDPDFTNFEKHAKKLSEILGRKVKYIDCVFCSHSLEEIKNLREGEILLLENSRFFSEENIERPGDVQANTYLVKKLSKVVDIYVDDAFATAHRSQPSLVGFPYVLKKSCAGRLMEKELRVISDILKKPKKPLTYILGGTKVDDAFKAAKKALENGADYILCGGLVGNIFLVAKGYRIGEPNIEFIRGKGMLSQIDVAKQLIEKFDKKIITPIDLALNKHGERVEISVGDLPKNFRIEDIGKKTVENFFSKIIKKSNTIFAKGALGVFENKKFSFGTEKTIKEIAANSKAYSIIGGGHLVASARELNVEDKITHISSGGGACISLLAGYKLPAVEALRGR